MTTIRRKRRQRGKRREQAVDLKLVMDEMIFGNAYFWCCRGRKHRVDPAHILVYRKEVAREAMAEIYGAKLNAQVIMDDPNFTLKPTIEC